MNVNFILTSGSLTPGYKRALTSARVHGAPIILWHCERLGTLTHEWLSRHHIGARKLTMPDWRMRRMRPEHQCHAFDVLAYYIGYKHGGMVLGLDTISLRSVFACRHCEGRGWYVVANRNTGEPEQEQCRCEGRAGLLADSDVVVSTDWALDDPLIGRDAAGKAHPYNNNFIAKKGSDGALALFTEARRRLLNEKEEWGYTGPLMLTDMVGTYGITAAPYPALCGWSPGYIWKFYLGLGAPPPEARVIHLCRTGYQALYDRDFEKWAQQCPNFAGEVANRTNLNDHLLC